MGWQTSVIPFLIAGNTTVINALGFFVYNGTPATGNMLVSISPFGGIDPYNNQFPAGIVLYGPAASFIAFEDSGAQPTLLMNPANVIHQTQIPQLFGTALNPGAVNEADIVTLSSGKNGHDDAALQFIAQAADTSTPATLITEFGGSITVKTTKDGLALPAHSGIPASQSGSGLIFGNDSNIGVVDGLDGNTYVTGRQTQVITTATPLAASPGTNVFTLPVNQDTGTRHYRVHGQFYISVSGAVQQLSIGVGVTGGSGHFGVSVMRAAAFINASDFAANVLTAVTAAGALAVGNTYIVNLEGVAIAQNSGVVNLVVTMAGTNANDLTVTPNSFCDFLPQ